MSPKDCAYIVERLAIRFMALVTDHERQLTEHRAAFGARTEADAKIIAGLRVQVQDMRAEMERLRAQMSEQEVSVVGIINERNETWERFWAEVARLKSQTPKHPVKVGEWVRRLTGFNTTPAGEVARVTLVDDDDASQLEYEVVRPNGQKGRWSAKGCEPCDPPIVKREPTIGDTVRLVKIPIMGEVSPALQKVLEWPWIERWGTLNQTALVVEPVYPLEGALSVCLSTNVHVRWPICCVEVVSEATHDTEAGKAAAESAAQHSAGIDIGTWSRKVTT